MAARGTRLWLELSDPATWRLGHDRSLQRQILADRAARDGRRLTFHRDTTRLYLHPVCYECGRDADARARDCDVHGIEMAYEERMPAAGPPLAFGTRADLERLGLVAAARGAA